MSTPLIVTGAAGFIGARFVESCNTRGIPVISVDEASFFAPDARPEHNGIDFGDVVDTQALISRLDSLGSLRGIVHLGAITDTTCFDEDLLRKVNLEYSQALWTHCTKHSVPLVYASSAATYGGGELGYDDDESKMVDLKPLNPYGESKLQFDLWALDQERAGHKPPSWSGFKFFNVYGYGERHKGPMGSVVLKAFDQIREQGGVRLFRSHHPDFRDGEQKRDFVYVQDVVDVLHFALEQPLARGIYNLGSGTARTFLDLVRAVFTELDAPENIDFVDTPVEIRDKYQYFTEARMTRLAAAGYTQPFHSLEDGVKSYIGRLLARA